MEKLLIAVILFAGFLGWGRLALAADAVPAANATSEAGSLLSTIENAAEGPEPIWNFHIQSTGVYQGDPGFTAKYSGINSLNSSGEAQETVSLDLFAGLRLWSGAEAHVDGLAWQGFGLSNTSGVEAFPNAQAYKFGTDEPYVTAARLFIRQTIGLGGEQEVVHDDPLTLAGRRDISRLTFTVGRFDLLDIFDRNTYAEDPTTQFLNWAMAGNLTWDYPSDPVGYTTGIAIELNQPKWALRYGFFQMPNRPNGFTSEDNYLMWRPNGNDGPFLKSWGMVAELEHRYSIDDHPGAIRFMPWLNEAHMASYHEATSILVAKGPGANLAAAQAYRYKYGFGLNWEQELAKGVGAFSRLGWNDGQQEAWVYTDANWTASLGVSVKGDAWQRSDDTLGLAGVISGASRNNQRFLNAGGLGILAGDGALSYGCETVVEAYYDLPIWKAVHATFDYQFVANPAFNRDRGPVNILGVRLHWQWGL